MNEQEYLEMANHFKEELNKKESIIKHFIGQNLELKKIIMMCYTYARQIDEYSNILMGGQKNEIISHSEALRGLMSEALDKYIFCSNDLYIVSPLQEEEL